MLAALNLRSEATALPRGQPPMCGLVGVLLAWPRRSSARLCLGVGRIKSGTARPFSVTKMPPAGEYLHLKVQQF